MLNISDLNLIIKYYAYQVQQRIEELEHLAHLPLDDQTNDPQHYEFIAIVSKYHGCLTNDEKEAKLARKLVERVLQIYDFFKTKSSSQNLLNLIQQRIQSELQHLVERTPIDLGELLSYVHLIAKRGGIVRVPAEKRRTFSKSIMKEGIKIMQGKMTPTLSFYHVQRKSYGINSTKHTKTPPYIQEKEKWKAQQILGGIWNCLEIQRGHLLRVRDGNEQLLMRDMMRRNDKINQAMRKFDRRCRQSVTEVSQENGGRQSTILSELKSNSMKGVWGGKRRRPLVSRKRNPVLKQNVSMLA